METGRALDCRTTRGVYGDRSCADLKRYTHCQNCPEYAAAGREALNRDISAERLREATTEVAKPLDASASERDSVVIFRIGAEWFALPTSACDGVTDEIRCHSIPHRRSGRSIGVASVRGELMASVPPVWLQPAASNEPSDRQKRRLLVLAAPGGRIAMPVDEVHGVERFDRRALLEAPATVPPLAGRFTCGVWQWRNRSLTCLHAGNLMPALVEALQ